MKHVKENNTNVMNCLDGSSCFSCMSNFDHRQKYKCVLNEDTILCPTCGADAVVPNTSFPDQETLEKWRRLRYRTYIGKDGTRYCNISNKPCDSNGIVIPSENFEYNDDTMKVSNDMYTTPDGYYLINEYYGYLNDKYIVYREVSIDGENFFIKSYFINDEGDLIEMKGR
jgi:hypothetical protein